MSYGSGDCLLRAIIQDYLMDIVKQVVSSKTVIVEAKMALLCLKKASGIAKGPYDLRIGLQLLKRDGNVLGIGTETTAKMGPKWLGVTATRVQNILSLFRLIVIPLVSKITWEPACYSTGFECIEVVKVLIHWYRTIKSAKSSWKFFESVSSAWCRRPPILIWTHI